jgi:phenylpropionate dioxygenase-like ring-hydroxylating dioxygenase large terminal subunit
VDDTLLERLKGEMAYEFARTAPPEGFPAFHDIPVGRYTSDEFWELEQEHLWSKVWVLAGREEDVASVGDYFLFEDLHLPIVVVRGKDDVVRAFYNTCQHRGAPVVREPAGTARTLRCQYHSWTYDITEGQLVSVPDERDFVGLEKAERCLARLRCEIWDGWVFVSRDLDAAPLLDWLGPIPEQLAELDGPNLRFVAKRSEIVTCNWKVTAEAFLEVYHFRHIHSRGPNDEAALDNRGATMGLIPGGHSRMITPFSKMGCEASGMADWSDWKMGTRPGFADIPTVNRMVRSTSSAYSVFPNLITPLAAYGFPFLLFWPIDKGTTRLDWIHWSYRDWDPADGLPDLWKRRLDEFDRIMEEDTRNMAPMQRSLESPAMRGVPINYQERRIWHLHEEIDRTIGEDRIPPDLRVEQLLEPYLER